MHKASNLYLLVAVIVSLGGFIFGFDASVISGVIGFVSVEFSLNEWQQGLVVSAPTLAACLSAIIVGPLSDIVGRKKVLISIASLYLISAIWSALAMGFWGLVLARATGGLAFGSLMLAPMYIAEITPAKKRGRVVSINQLNIMVGFSAAYFANYFLLQLSQADMALVQSIGLAESPWRWMLAMEFLPALIWVIALLTIPESPRWLMGNGKVQEGKAILHRIMPSVEAEREFEAIQHSMTTNQTVEKMGIADSLKRLFHPSMNFVLMVGLIIGISQQITGINAVYFYAPGIFQQSGVGTDAAFAQAIWVGIINVVFTVLAMMSIDKLGRKPLLIIGLSGVFLSMSLVAYGFNEATYRLDTSAIEKLQSNAGFEILHDIAGKTFNDDVEFKNELKSLLGTDIYTRNEADILQSAISMNPMLILTGILGFVASFAFSLGPVMWVLFSEIFPTAIRGFAISAMGFVNSLVSFGVQFLFPWELANLGTALTFLIYGIFALIGLILVIWLFPETKEKSL
ncbi:MAG: sugar porter family MFS transporter, partial [Calditrichota bacterium]